MKLTNETDLVVDRFVVQDAQGRDLLLVVAKATYDLVEGCLVMAKEQAPLVFADEYYGDPETSSIRYSSDVVWGKTSTDIAVLGDAVAPDEKTRQMDVVLEVGKLKHSVRVFGDRKWVRGATGWRLSKPEVFDRMPLRYERAFGGVDRSHADETKHYAEARNPLGCGIWDKKKSGIKPKDLSVPNLEDPNDLIRKPLDKPVPTGFGFLPGHWEPRLGLAGIYDEKWMQERMPLLASDFDPKHNQSAHPALIYDGFLKGDEKVVVTGVRAEGGYAFRLPGVQLECVVDMGSSDPLLAAMSLNKLMVDTDEKKVFMTWCAEFDVHGRLYEIEDITVQKQEHVALAL